MSSVDPRICLLIASKASTCRRACTRTPHTPTHALHHQTSVNLLPADTTCRVHKNMDTHTKLTHTHTHTPHINTTPLGQTQQKHAHASAPHTSHCTPHTSHYTHTHTHSPTTTHGNTYVQAHTHTHTLSWWAQSKLLIKTSPCCTGDSCDCERWRCGTRALVSCGPTFDQYASPRRWERAHLLSLHKPTVHRDGASTTRCVLRCVRVEVNWTLRRRVRCHVT